MKKIWKNLCACSLAMACTGGLVACGKDDTPVSKDLDGDGVISAWETLYEDVEHKIGKVLPAQVTYISTADDLLNINNDTEQKVYVLKNNIDMGGQEVSINLGLSEFYGFNYVISNFKLATLKGSDLGESGYENTHVKALFRNGAGIFSTRIFMGAQTLSVDSMNNTSSYYISPVFNVPVVSDVDVKGKITINGVGLDNRVSASVNASLLYTGMSKEIVKEDESITLENDVTCIDNVNVDGEIVIDNQLGSRIAMNVGSIASAINKNSVIYNCYAQTKILTSSYESESNIAGIVGLNKGFVSTCTYTGDINLNNEQELSVLFGDGIRIGGIVGFNDKLAEVKNCSTNAQISLTKSDSEYAKDSSEYYVGGISGVNDTGVIELCQSDAVISFVNMYSITAGGLCGVSNDGVISYNICRGSISATNVANVVTAQAVGFAKNGMFEKLMATTALNVNNSERITEKLDLGMVTVFDDAETSPYFRKIMVDGISRIYTRDADNRVFNYKHGLRYPYQVQVGMEEEEYVYDTIVPNIFENLYKTESCKVFKYSVVGTGLEPVSDMVNISYANNSVKNSTLTTRWMIDYMDFKNYLNHNEVSLDLSLSLNTLHFTITDENKRLESYFGGGKYNGELAYFDREFTESYNHENNAFGSCENDTKDEMLSFVYNLIKSNNGKPKETYTIKVDSSYIDRAPDNVETLDGLSADTNIFINKICNIFGCLSTSVSVTHLDADGNDLAEDETGLLMAKYVEISFSDATNKYVMTLDISNMQNTSRVTEENPDAFIVYLIFSVSNKIV